VTLVRVGMARFRINQVVTVYWVYISIIGLAGILLMMIDAALVAAPGVV
jgi:formate hydrogenlyase subunit 4